MTNTFIFSKKAQHSFLNLDASLQKRITKKLQEMKQHPSIFSKLERVFSMGIATHRLRIGDYRVLLSNEKQNVFVIIDIGHRSNIYK